MEIFHLYFSKIDSLFHTVIEPNICVLSAESAWQVDFNIETVRRAIPVILSFLFSCRNLAK